MTPLTWETSFPWSAAGRFRCFKRSRQVLISKFRWWAWACSSSSLACWVWAGKNSGINHVLNTIWSWRLIAGEDANTAIPEQLQERMRLLGPNRAVSFHGPLLPAAPAAVAQHIHCSQALELSSSPLGLLLPNASAPAYGWGAQAVEHHPELSFHHVSFLHHLINATVRLRDSVYFVFPSHL